MLDIHYRLNTDFPAMHGRASETACFRGGILPTSMCRHGDANKPRFITEQTISRDRSWPSTVQGNPAPAPAMRKKAKRELGAKSEGKCSGNRAVTMVRARTRRDLNDCHIQKKGSFAAFRNHRHRPARTSHSNSSDHRLNDGSVPCPEASLQQQGPSESERASASTVGTPHEYDK